MRTELLSQIMTSVIHLFWFVSPFRSPPRPSPGSLHYSDEDVSVKYNDLVPAESSSLTEKPSEVSDSQVIHSWHFSSCFVKFDLNHFLYARSWLMFVFIVLSQNALPKRAVYTMSFSTENVKLFIHFGVCLHGICLFITHTQNNRAAYGTECWWCLTYVLTSLQQKVDLVHHKDQRRQSIYISWTSYTYTVHRASIRRRFQKLALWGLFSVVPQTIQLFNTPSKCCCRKRMAKKHKKFNVFSWKRCSVNRL